MYAQQRFTFFSVPEDKVWSRLQGFATKNPERELALKALLTEAGCKPEHLSEEKVAHSSLPNLICVVPGATDRTIIVGAHFDKVKAGDGVADNWSGASLLPSLLEALSKEARKHTYIFIAFTDEEKGLVGSDYHARHMAKEERQKVSAMINLDTVGLEPAEVWANPADKNLLKALSTVATSMKLPLSIMNVDGVGTTDSESFHQNNMPALTIHSVTPNNFRLLHTDKDNIKLVQRKDYVDTYRLMCGYLAFLDVYLDQSLATQAISNQPEK
jgi:Peptidase family M28